jgi:hypothetical protein
MKINKKRMKKEGVLLLGFCGVLKVRANGLLLEI